MTNFIIDKFFGFEDGLIKVSVMLAVRAWRSFSRIVQLLKFNHLFAYWLFVFKKGVDSFKNWKKLAAGHAPQNLVSTIWDVAFVEEVKLTTKPSRSPEEKRRLSVVTLKLCPVTRIFSIFMECLADIKTAFSVYVASQISEIVDRWTNCIADGFKLFFRRGVDYSIPMFQIVHMINGALFSFFFKISGSIAEFKKCMTFIGFLNQKWKDIGKIFVSFFAKHKMIRWKSVFLFRNLYLDGSLEMACKPFDVVLVSRDNRKGVLIKWRSFNSSKIKTTIPIDVACGVSKICTFVHAA